MPSDFFDDCRCLRINSCGQNIAQAHVTCQINNSKNKNHQFIMRVKFLLRFFDLLDELFHIVNKIFQKFLNFVSSFIFHIYVQKIILSLNENLTSPQGWELFQIGYYVAPCPHLTSTRRPKIGRFWFFLFLQTYGHNLRNVRSKICKRFYPLIKYDLFFMMYL